jgi:hypothetical protein
VCVCEGSFKEEEKGAGFIIPMADMICSMALGETHTHSPFALRQKWAGVSFFF